MLTHDNSPVYLKRLSLDDARLLYPLLIHPEVKPFFFDPHFVSIEQHMKFMEGIQETNDLAFGIWEKTTAYEVRIGKTSSTETLIGQVHIYHISYRTWERRCELGRWMMYPDVQGRGYGKWVGYLILRHAFGDLGLHKVYLEVFADNDKAVKVYTRLGFHAIGVFSKHVYKDGYWKDVIAMEILVEDWMRKHEKIVNWVAGISQ